MVYSLNFCKLSAKFPRHRAINLRNPTPENGQTTVFSGAHFYKIGIIVPHIAELHRIYIRYAFLLRLQELKSDPLVIGCADCFVSFLKVLFHGFVV